MAKKKNSTANIQELAQIPFASHPLVPIIGPIVGEIAIAVVGYLDRESARALELRAVELAQEERTTNRMSASFERAEALRAVGCGLSALGSQELTQAERERVFQTIDRIINVG